MDELDKLNPVFNDIGYHARGENGITERRYFEKGGDNRSHQIHAFLKGSENTIRHLAFRDYLIHHPSIASEYGKLKKTIANQCDNDIEKYCDLKNDFIQYHEKQAIKWYTLTNRDSGLIKQTWI